MQAFYSHPSEMAGWHELIGEAQLATNTRLPEQLESYLVFTLMRFIKNTDFLFEPVALDSLNLQSNLSAQLNLIKSNTHQHDALKHLGDRCLLLSGLFPKITKRQNLCDDYFIHIGKNAYLSLSYAIDGNPPNNSFSHKLFYELHEGFTALMDLLQATRNLYKPNTLQ